MKVECPEENFDDLFKRNEEDDFYYGCDNMSFTDYVNPLVDSLIDFYNKDVTISLDRLAMMMNIAGCSIDFKTYTPMLWAMNLLSYMTAKVGSFSLHTTKERYNTCEDSIFYNDKFLPISCMICAKDFDECYKNLEHFNTLKNIAMTMPDPYFQDRLRENLIRRHHTVNFKTAEFIASDMDIYNMKDIPI